MLLRYHIGAMLFGFMLDLIIGDPYCLPHPIRLIGNWISFLEKKLLGEKQFAQDKAEEDDKVENEIIEDDKSINEINKLGEVQISKSKVEQSEIRKGILLVCCVLGMTGIISAVILAGAYWIHPILGVLIESIMTYQILAMKCLKVESMKVYDQLKKGDLAAARTAVSMIVGRDTNCLDETGVAKAAIETVAENTSDGVLAPMLYTALGGPVLGFLYKAVNTMDSMVGYKNETYLYFGRAAAKLDDVVNFLPARISAVFLVLASFIGGKEFHGKNAWKIFQRDRFQHASPNSAQTESTCAGALGIQLAGDASYFGKVVKKPFIGDPIRKVENEDIKRVNKLMYIAAFLCEACCLILLGGVYLCVK